MTDEEVDALNENWRQKSAKGFRNGEKRLFYGYCLRTII